MNKTTKIINQALSEGRKVLLESETKIHMLNSEWIALGDLNSSKQKLLDLSNTTKSIMSELSECNYKVALEELSLISNSIRDVGLSGNLPDDVANALGPLSQSIDSCIALLYEGIRKGDAGEIVQKKNILRFLKGLERVLADFSKMK